MNFTTIANVYVRDRQYNVHVSINNHTRAIHIFKYSEQHTVCEYEMFNNHIDAADYLELLLKGK
jgi:hypothetical protein